MTTHHFILTLKPGDKEPVLYWVKDMPKPILETHPELDSKVNFDFTPYQNEHAFKIGAAVDSSIRVSNPEIFSLWPYKIGEIVPIECIVEIKESRFSCNCIAKGSDFEEDHLQYCDSNVKHITAFVKLKEETKETPFERLRNLLSPAFNLPKMILADEEKLKLIVIQAAKQAVINNHKILEIIKELEAVTKEEEQDKEELRVFLYDCLKFGSKISYDQSILLTEKLLSNFIITKRQ